MVKSYLMKVYCNIRNSYQINFGLLYEVFGGVKQLYRGLKFKIIYQGLLLLSVEGFLPQIFWWAQYWGT
ncbi:hypothetical protein XENTR_v10011333 [Xenopus tropicalis]|nr:hypothetical protein XENTR_v10011333 [Xenopus tropicalis]